MNRCAPEALKTIAAECPGFQARATARALTRYYNRCFKPLELTAEQFSLLVGIGSSEGATLGDLADKAGIDATTLSRNMRTLERRGLIRATGGRGRGGKRLTLTQSGNQLLLAAVPAWEQARTELAHHLGDDNIRPIKQAMAALAMAAKSAGASFKPNQDNLVGGHYV